MHQRNLRPNMRLLVLPLHWLLPFEPRLSPSHAGFLEQLDDTVRPGPTLLANSLNTRS
jgi:hypothetical protein